MGRSKKEIIQPSEEGLIYAMEAIQGYSEMRQFCDDFELAYPSLFAKGKVNRSAFEELGCLSKDTFVMPDLAVFDADRMNDYLADREKVYLFEYALEQMENGIREIAESLFIGRLSWEEIMRKHCVSKMTVCRYRKEAIRQLAVIVDGYMEWKVQCLFV